MVAQDEPQPTAEETPTYISGREGVPELRLLHYNDVYHIEAGSREPVGGISRFQSVASYYRSDDTFSGQPGLLTLFSGDAFNPSLESSVTKGSHMVPVLNHLGTDVACVGNHDLDFGITQFKHLASKCEFPWLLANVTDPALGEDVPLGNVKKTVILTASNGIKVGVIGLVEREWLDTINSLPPNLVYKSATATAKELVPKLREQGAEIIIAVTHAREPNDNKLAAKAPEGLIDLILGGHDHFYKHSIINGTHILRSGTDFKQLSYIKAWRKEGSKTRWDFDIIRRDIVGSISEDAESAALVEKISAGLRTRLEKPIGFTAAPLDARFTTCRLKESNFGNFVCDLMRLYYQADCAIMAAGTMRGDQVYPPGILRLKDLMGCFPFEDPVVVLRVSGQALWDALENGVALYPALEGRFPQVSNIHFTFSPSAPQGSRIKSLKIGDEPIDLAKMYVLATREYMTRGKDGYHSLLAKSNGGTAEEIVSEENGILISMVLRQYFLSLKVLGRWRRWCEHMHNHWKGVHDDLHDSHPVIEPATPLLKPIISDAIGQTGPVGNGNVPNSHENGTRPRTPPKKKHKHASSVEAHIHDSDSEDDHLGHKPVIASTPPSEHEHNQREYELMIMRKVLRKWWRLAGMSGHPGLGESEEGEFVVGWTRGIAPRVEKRIRIVD